jgi:hypothetical protein
MSKGKDGIVSSVWRLISDPSNIISKGRPYSISQRRLRIRIDKIIVTISYGDNNRHRLSPVFSTTGRIAIINSTFVGNRSIYFVDTLAFVHIPSNPETMFHRPYVLVLRNSWKIETNILRNKSNQSWVSLHAFAKGKLLRLIFLRGDRASCSRWYGIITFDRNKRFREIWTCHARRQVEFGVIDRALPKFNQYRQQTMAISLHIVRIFCHYPPLTIRARVLNCSQRCWSHDLLRDSHFHCARNVHSFFSQRGSQSLEDWTLTAEFKVFRFSLWM